MTLIILVFLTIIGIAATTTSSLESQISGNSHRGKIAFYAAESGWRDGAMWLDDKAAVPRYQDLDLTIKYYGSANDDPNEDFQGPEDGDVAGTPYWYKIVHTDDDVVTGSEENFRRFVFETTSVGDGHQQIDVQLAKIFKVGY